MSDTSQAPVVEKEKNPKRVAAGKVLAEKNKKYKEHYEKTAGVTKTEVEPTPVVTESKSGGNSAYYVIGSIALGVAGLMYNQSTQNSP